MFMFGAGNVYLTPAGTTPTPIKVGTLQEVSFDISFESKELYGNKQFPVMVARGKGKITGKAKSGEFKGGLILSLLSGSTQATGRKAQDVDVTAVPVTPGPYTYTAVPPASGTWAADLGVEFAATGIGMKRVTTPSSSGEYSVAAGGIYTFAAADQGVAIKVHFEYTLTTGSTISYSNQLMGSQSIYQLGLYNTNPDGSLFGIKFKNVVIPKLAMGFKNDDFTMPDLDMSAFASADDTILEAYQPE